MVPDRFAAVAAICRAHPEAFPRKPDGSAADDNDAARLVLLRGVIIKALNVNDGGLWGCLTKTDQGNKIPCDVLVYGPNNWGVDCMTGDGPCWDVYPTSFAGNPAWHWTAVRSDVPPRPTPPTPDASEPVYFGALSIVGTLVPQPDDWVVLIGATGEVASIQPDGRLEWRPAGTVGAYERARRLGLNLVEYTVSGARYVVGVVAR
jgi:hypothetical protein